MALVDRVLRARLHESLGDLRDSQLTVVDAIGDAVLGAPAQAAAATLRATVQVRDPAFYRAVARSGSVGAGESYIDGAWECDDLVALVRMLVRNRDRLDAMDSGSAYFAGLALRAWHALRRNTRRGSRGNIAAHYDLGNAFFETFLGDDLMYSSAIFAAADEPLAAASTRKLERICRKLQLSPGDRVVEIGGGWGGFALHAARHYGCHVTTTTISPRQHEFAQRRVKDALAFAVSLTTRSAFGTAFHLAQMRRRDVTDAGVMEVVGVTQMFSSYTKIADTLQLQPDMGHIAPADPSGVPGQ